MSDKTPGIPLVGGLLAAVAASLCCVGPLVVLVLGIGGAWVSHLTALEPYRPLLIGLTMLCLVIAYRKIFVTSRRTVCEAGTLCAQPRTRRGYQLMFWGVVITTLVSIASPYALPLFY